MKKLILLLAFLGLVSFASPKSKNKFDYRQEKKMTDNQGERFTSIMEVLKMVESKGKKNAKSRNGIYLGVLQISKVCVREVNYLYGTKYKHKDAMSVKKSEDMFMKIMTAGAKRIRTKHNREATDEELVRMWNGGIYSGYKSGFTKKYYQKYLRYKKKYF